MYINPNLPSNKDVIVSLSGEELNLLHRLVFDLIESKKQDRYFLEEDLRTFLTHINEASNLVIEASWS